MSEMKKDYERVISLIPNEAQTYIQELEQKLDSLQESECPWCEGTGLMETYTTEHCDSCNGTGKLPATHVIVPIFEQIETNDEVSSVICKHAELMSTTPSYVWRAFKDIAVKYKAAQETDDG